MSKLSVLLTMEGTYPYIGGGVSTWCHELITNLPQIDYSLISIIDSPFTASKYKLPDNVKEFIRVPLWGTQEPSEHIDWVPFSSIFKSKLETTPKVIEEKFIPVFSEIIEEIFRIRKQPKVLGINLLKAYMYFRKYDYHSTLKLPTVYRFYKQKILDNISNYEYFFAKDRNIPAICEIEESLGWVFRFLNIINTSVPRTDITHSSAAGFCGIPNIISKMLYNTPFLLTEHGVYIREQYLSDARRKMPHFMRNFFIFLIESIVKLNYKYADIICPVCNYNSKWERMLGVNPEKIKVIYNGVDSEVFDSTQCKNDKLKIIAVARIDPLKDIENFIQASGYILDQFPEIEFAVYGSITDDKYYKKCLKLIKSLNLEKKLKFYGYVENPQQAYESGDIIVLSSKSEGFPYSIVEAMMCGKPIVATDVGGVSEAIGACGVVVKPGDPIELANACVKLIKDEDLRLKMGIKARERASSLFTIEKFAGAYQDVYNFLINH